MAELAPRLIADFNVRLAKPAPHDHDGHRPVRAAEDLDLIFSWRLQRNVSRSLAAARQDHRRSPREDSANSRSKTCRPQYGSVQREPTALASSLQQQSRQHDLPPVGLCVAVTTPPGDKSAPRLTTALECNISAQVGMRHLNLALTTIFSVPESDSR